MIVFKPEERLYPATWGYNAARITSALAAIVENNDGRVHYGNAAIISNRTLAGLIRETEERLEKLKAMEADPAARAIPARTAAIKALEKDLEEFLRFDNSPIRVTHTTYIRFFLDGVYYSYHMDDNPFFDFGFIKTPAADGHHSQDAAIEEDNKKWFDDCFLSFRCSNEDIKEAAYLIFNMLQAAPFSKIMRDGRRVRVKNTYNNGYHYETIQAPERIAKIDF